MFEGEEVQERMKEVKGIDHCMVVVKIHSK